MNWTLFHGHALDVLRTLPSCHVQCIVTSPPYWGLRDYGHADQIGLEPTPDAYVAELIEVFREVRRVLRDDGTLWLNLGDSYAGVGAQTGGTNSKEHGRRKERMFKPGIVWAATNLKAKDLVGVPWRVAFALQADGWYLRSDIIYSKPNPMPESVRDRPTKAHEYLFLLTKSARYQYDAAAIREPVTQAMLDQMRQGYDGEGQKDYESAGVQNPSSVKARIIAGKRDKQRGHRRRHAGFNARWDSLTREAQMAQGANARTVWNIATEASPYEHFAVMPKALARRCILAGCPQDGTVLDPFAGVCTTGVVAIEEGRNFIGIELNPQYHAMGRDRLADVAPLLAVEVSA
jgi:DNA modification methylase